MSPIKTLLLSSTLLLSACTMTQRSDVAANLTFKDSTYQTVTTTVNGKSVRYRAYEGVVYVSRPEDAAYQSMNIYIPEEYFEGKSVGSYTAQTAPIFLPNQIGGYMPAKPGTPGLRTAPGGSAAGGQAPAGGGTGTTSAAATTAPATTGSAGSAATAPAAPAASTGTPNAMLLALSRGYVVASPGARGRTSKNSAGEYTGKAPAAIVDLKAAVRYLHFNDSRMPGNAERIISNGTSAGGALSALLGATGNNPEYVPYLNAAGAAPGRDDIFAVSSYCPITNLENADAAYEWQFNGVNDYQKLQITQNTDFQMQRTLVSGTLTADEIKVSAALKPRFTPYLNSLNLTAGGTPLTLDQNGNGTFKTYVASQVQASAQRALDSGTNLSGVGYLTISGGRVTAIDFDAYVKALGRMKLPPAFDHLGLEAGENELFGSRTVNTRHFTAFGTQNSKVAGTTAPADVVRLMNPMNFIGAAKTQTAGYWRIRHGSADKDTSLAISTILATTLQSAGQQVDFALPWNVAHSGDYDLPELFAWMDKVVAQPTRP